MLQRRIYLWPWTHQLAHDFAVGRWFAILRRLLRGLVCWLGLVAPFPDVILVRAWIKPGEQTFQVVLFRIFEILRDQGRGIGVMHQVIVEELLPRRERSLVFLEDRLMMLQHMVNQCAKE